MTPAYQVEVRPAILLGAAAEGEDEVEEQGRAEARHGWRV
jgi:hypothetical protein